MREAIFAAGCFWGVESRFREIDGVVDAEVGYTGGGTADPTYKQVCSGRTGHAEAVRLTYEPDLVSYEQLLDAFWAMHNPRSRNRQGFDIGSQYRSAIFTHGDDQRDAAVAARAALERDASRWRGGIATQIADAGRWYPAEDYHQQYHEKQRTRRA